ncbi:hypothetical protein G6045_14015 [Streptomyces sp. YC504]|uniref:Molecular chaperone DnaJ n=1 Tax=Streptomyces mesophilus TaxID=1775132 RepID=A0A6G4XHS3_9ACTN|nr:hypothetical protein [Streptomyces mesophilus]
MPPALLAIALLAFITGCYCLMCAISPFGTCRKCRGMGGLVKTTIFGRIKASKNCPRCKGHGKRIRVGRWIYNRAARIYRDSHPESTAKSRIGTPR